MGRVNQLFQDDRQRQAEEYMAAHPGADEEEAYEELFGHLDREGPEPE